MPSLGADMEAGTLVDWLVKPGDVVKRGDVVAVVETQKGAIEIETFQAGTIEKILVDLNTKVPVGTVLAQIRSADEAATTHPPVSSTVPAVIPRSMPGPEVLTTAVPPRPPLARPASGRVRASPAARQLAQSRGVDLAAIMGSGPRGEITRSDVERALSTPSAEKKRTAGLDLDAMRVAIAAAMARSKREIPHYYLEHHVDLTSSEEWLAQTNSARLPDNRVLMGALAIKAVALAARKFPTVNGFYRVGKFEMSPSVHVGVAIAIRGGGLAAPALHDADHLKIDDLMMRLRDLVQRTRAGRIRGSEISDPTITVSSLGERGVESLYGIIYPPQVAIVGVGRIVIRPWVVNDKIVPRSVVSLTLSADHRVSDGHAGGLFLAEIGKLLQEPEKL